MALTFEDDRDAFLAVLSLVIGADQVGSLRERDYLLGQVRTLPLFGDMGTTEFTKLLGEVTERVYVSALGSEQVGELLVQAKSVLGPELCQTVVQSATGLCAADGSARDEDELLLQIRQTLA